jgi:hypothetical protein
MWKLPVFLSGLTRTEQRELKGRVSGTTPKNQRALLQAAADIARADGHGRANALESDAIRTFVDRYARSSFDQAKDIQEGARALRLELEARQRVEKQTNEVVSLAASALDKRLEIAAPAWISLVKVARKLPADLPSALRAQLQDAVTPVVQRLASLETLEVPQAGSDNLFISGGMLPASKWDVFSPIQTANALRWLLNKAPQALSLPVSLTPRKVTVQTETNAWRSCPSTLSITH